MKSILRIAARVAVFIALAATLLVVHQWLLALSSGLPGLLPTRPLKLTALLLVPVLVTALVALAFAYPLVKAYPRHLLAAALGVCLPTVLFRMSYVLGSSGRPFVIAAHTLGMLAPAVLVPACAWWLARSRRAVAAPAEEPSRPRGGAWRFAQLLLVFVPVFLAGVLVTPVQEDPAVLAAMAVTFGTLVGAILLWGLGAQGRAAPAAWTSVAFAAGFAYPLHWPLAHFVEKSWPGLETGILAVYWFVLPYVLGRVTRAILRPGDVARVPEPQWSPSR